MPLNHVKGFFEDGKFQEVLNQLNQLETQNGLTSLDEEKQVECIYYKCRSLERMGKVRKALECANNARIDFSTLRNPNLILLLLLAQLYALKELGQLDKAIEVYQEGDRIVRTIISEARWSPNRIAERVDPALEFCLEGLELRKNTGAKSDVAHSLHCLGELHRREFLLYLTHQQSLDQAMDYYKQSLIIREEIENKQGIAENLRGIGQIYFYRREFDRGLEYLQKSLTLYEELGNDEETAEVLSFIGAISYFQGKINIGLETMKKSLSLYETCGNKKAVAYTYYFLGQRYGWGQGEFKLASEFFQKSLALYEELEDKRSMMIVLYYYGAEYRRMGEFDHALDYFKKGMKIAEELGYNEEKALFHHAFGWFYVGKGELDLGITHCHKSIAIFEEIKNKDFYFWIQYPLSNLGMAYRTQGNFKTALKYYKKSLTLCEEWGHDLGIAINLYELVTLAIDMNSREQAKTYLQQLKELKVEYTSGVGLHHMILTAEGKVLKTSTRLRDRVRAQQLMQQVVDDKIINYYVTIDALLILIELCLFEVKSLGDKEAYQELKSLIIKLREITQKQKLSDLQINLLMFQAQFEAIDGNLQIALELLNQAKKIAEERNLGLLAKQVMAEQLQLEAEMEKWLDYIQRNVSLQERLEQAHIEHYIKGAQKLVNLLDRMGL
ncbi:MAG: tetratricopeptide repeat protein [Candidatus Hodarchaeota archaeon]